ncbi:molybdenum cofactor guanylyltransferase [Jeotgalibacillus soli]|uniref:Probable molybdenum cofactor guanylyltransferase n=1 Tax=Jeotgalibacillus soli TaxID=889306 RepID=A0A0C2VSK1_9BACL|nr:molybdenum cofactor guanylyltransferase [Jeotgalibacillus soli]KIL51902.1 hypothetical protein KP78_02720 [Jeotgalibacillus soli]
MNDKKPGLAGVILAGGESKRFRSSKAFATYNNQYFYESALEALSPYTDQNVIVSQPSLSTRFIKEKGFSIIEDIDPFKGKGPLSGIYAAMKQCPASWYFVLPCDMPRMNAAAAGKLAAQIDRQFDAVIPNVFGRIQPLAGLYHRSTLTQLEEQLSLENYRMIHFLNKINTKYVTEQDLAITEDVFQNVNDQDEYKLLLENNSSST